MVDDKAAIIPKRLLTEITVGFGPDIQGVVPRHVEGQGFDSPCIGQVVQLLQPRRFDSQNTGKFPAYYSLCRGSTGYMRKTLADVGFTNIEVHEYYGHHYYDKLFGLRQLENWFSRLCARRGWAFYSSYAIIVTRR